jgi:LCP family protein required for cell wall assembly
LPNDYTRGRGIWKRVLLGAFLIVVSAASATAVAAFHEVDRVVNAFRQEPRLDVGNELATADAGKPQTIMLIGSDRRSKTAIDYDPHPRSDTIILVRLDPSKQATAMLSIPRDLKVTIPGRGTSKINEAYSLGGPKLTLQVVKQLTGLRINHVINVDFKGFVEAVNQLKCVYMDIDHRYFNSGQGPDSYAAIDLQPGYQKLCGTDALSFVRFRHTDTDIVRAARQQEFLAQMKQQVGVGTLFSQRAKLLKIFGKYTRSDIRSRATVLRLLKLALASAGHPIQQVQFTANLGPSYVTASLATVRRLADEFLGVKSVKAANRTKKRRHRRRKASASLNLIDSSALGKQTALQTVTEGSRIPVWYPRRVEAGDHFLPPPRAYAVRSRSGRIYHAYRIVVKGRGLGQYWGIQGLGWKSPPVLEGEHETKHIHGRTFNIYFEGNATRLVAWKTRDAVYWVQNTLSAELTEDQMLAIARSSRPL